MHSISVLLTCFNRKDKTLAALQALYKAHEVSSQLSLTIYLTDDGSTDGTGDAVRKNYPQAKVLQGSGELYWAGGMRNSWREALKGNYDGYLLLNDDTEPYENFLQELLETHIYCTKKYNQGGVYVGSTLDGETNDISYGGYIFTNKFMGKFIRVIPNKKTPQECELGNANILLVHKDAVDKIGILTEGYGHGMADYDYTLKAVKANIPTLVTSNILGVCTNDHTDPYLTFHELPFKERAKKLYYPVGLDFKSQLLYMKRNFWYRLPLVYVAGWLKILFPKFYYNRMYKNR
ncbi:MAG: glycosyltransferase family 2 protein [Maribacter sp.]